MKVLPDNSVFGNDDNEGEVDLKAEDIAVIKAAISDVDQFATMTFRIRKTYLKVLRDYAYTNRSQIKTVLDEILEKFVESVDTSTLIEAPERLKKTTDRRRTIIND